MRTHALLTVFLLSMAVAARAEVTSADLIGHWTSGKPEEGAWRNFTFRADHSFDGIGGDAHSAGKWKLHHGNKLELIIHYDYDPKPISRSSPRFWYTIESIDKGRMRLRFHSTFDSQLLPPEVWTKRR